MGSDGITPPASTGAPAPASPQATEFQPLKDLPQAINLSLDHASRRNKHLRKHAIVQILVAGFLIFLNIITSRFPWSMYPITVGMAIYTIHYVVAANREAETTPERRQRNNFILHFLLNLYFFFMLFFTWAYAGRGFPWFFYPIFATGVALIIHWFCVFQADEKKRLMVVALWSHLNLMILITWSITTAGYPWFLWVMAGTAVAFFGPMLLCRWRSRKAAAVTAAAGDKDGSVLRTAEEGAGAQIQPPTIIADPPTPVAPVAPVPQSQYFYYAHDPALTGAHGAQPPMYPMMMVAPPQGTNPQFVPPYMPMSHAPSN